MIERTWGGQRDLDDLVFQRIEHASVHANEHHIPDACANVSRMGTHQAVFNHLLAVPKEVCQIFCSGNHVARMVHRSAPTCCRPLRSFAYPCEPGLTPAPPSSVKPPQGQYELYPFRGRK